MLILYTQRNGNGLILKTFDGIKIERDKVKYINP